CADEAGAGVDSAGAGDAGVGSAASGCAGVSSAASGDAGVGAVIRALYQEFAGSKAAKEALSIFEDDTRNIAIRELIGNDLAGKITANILNLCENVALSMTGSLFEETRLSLHKLSILVIDQNALNRFEQSIGNKTFSELLGRERSKSLIDFISKKCEHNHGVQDAGKWSSSGVSSSGVSSSGAPFSKATSSWTASSGAPFSEVLSSGIANALGNSVFANETYISDVLNVDRKRLDTFLSATFSSISASSEVFINSQKESIERMIQTSIDNAIKAGQEKRGAVTFARKTLFKDASRRYKIAELLSEYVKGLIDGLPRAYDADFVIERLMEVKLSAAIERLNFNRSFDFSVEELISRFFEAAPGEIIKKIPSGSKERLLDMLRSYIVTKCADGIAPDGNVYSFLEKMALSQIEELMSRKAVDFERVIKANLSFSGFLREDRLWKSLSRAAADRLERKGYFQTEAAAGLHTFLSDIKPSDVMKKIITMPALSVKRLAAQIARLLSAKFEVLIKGKVKATISGRLSQLSNADVLALAEKFFGQLKHITVLGGIIGGIMGAAAGFYKLAGSGTPSIAAAANIILMAITGWLTNVIALELLFRPHRTINVFGYKFMSVIKSNKEKLASTIGAFVDETLLSNEASAQIVETNREALRDVIVSNIVKRQYSAVRAVVCGNSGELGERMAKTLVGYVGENRGEVSERLYGELCKLALPRPATEPHDGCALFEQKEMGWVMAVIENIFSIIAQSDKKITELLGGFDFRTDVESRLRNFDDIEFRRLFRELIGASIEKWRQTYGNDALIKSGDSLHAAIKSILSIGQVGEALAENIASVLSGGVERLIERYVNQNFDRIALEQKDRLIKFFRDSKEQFAGLIKPEIKGRTGFLQSLALAAADVDGLLEYAIDDFVEDQIPEFIDSRFNELRKLARDLLNEAIIKISKSAPFSVDISKVGTLLSEILSDEIFIDEMSLLISEEAFRLFSDVKNEDFLSAADINTLKNLLLAADPIIRAASGALTESVRIEAEDIATELLSLKDYLTSEIGEKLNLSNLLRGYSEKDFSVLKKCAADAICKSGMIGEAVSLIKSRIADRDLVMGLISELTGVVCEDRGVQNDLAEAVAGILEDMGKDVEDILDEEFLGVIANLVAEVMISTMRDNLPQILSTMKFKEITEKQINLMDTVQIERMFKSFAGGYITRIKLYGLWGGVLGLHFSLPVLSFICAVILRLRTKLCRARRNRRPGAG
ncbi:MAG: hypothetical protein FWH55_08650, partial [Oscillospiraceae bacterium]|nr:hypothetical protein [Oscillospiraceae bacterium]